MTLAAALLALVMFTVLASWAARRAVRNDGATPPHPARHQDEWSHELPTHPYSERPIA